MVSLNTYAVTQPALEGLEPSLDGFTYDVTAWLHEGRNTLTVVLIGPPSGRPFRMSVCADGEAAWTLDEDEFLPLSAPWRLWTIGIERQSEAASTGRRAGRRPPLRLRS
ncbi:hypothetical protein J2X36_000691 [Methylobacterium sp. BE186]|uniref:hypothetical protein n=1 Tax=Methylobacterium sp. BE186 TaxID=2817715 RepID=UPI002858B6D3|nr:hypothetical protein [Methylobacterium sp. BE186]MDR7035955.1 hypothetical protein [Methylobacterium sp. BE186]